MTTKELLQRHIILKCLIIVLATLTSIAYFHQLLAPLMKGLLVLGAAAVIYDIITRRFDWKDWTFWLLLAFALAYAVTAYFNGDEYTGRAIKDMLYMVVLFAVLYRSPKLEGTYFDRERIILTRVAFISMLALMLACYIAGRFFPSSTYTTADGVTGYIGFLDDRLCGLVHMNVTGAVSALLILLGAGALLLSRGENRTAHAEPASTKNHSAPEPISASPRFFTPWRIVYALGIVVGTLCLVLSKSRTSIAALIVALLYAIIRFAIYEKMSQTARKRAGKIILIVIIAILLIIAAIAIILAANGQLTEGINAVIARADSLLTGRVSIWLEGLRQFLQHPILGVTSQNFASTAVVNNGFDWNGGGLHSVYVAVPVASGIVGCLILTAFTILNLIRGHKIAASESPARHMAGVLLCFLLVQALTENYLLYSFSFFAVIFWLVMGVRKDG